MKYLINIISLYEGEVLPISNQYKDSNGDNKFLSNISIANYMGKLITNTRLVDYAYLPISAPDIIQYLTINHDIHQMSSSNVLRSLSDDKSTYYEFFGNKSTTLINGVSYKGLEDLRLVVWNNTLYGIGFRPDVIENKVIPQLIEYNEDLSIRKSWFLNTNKGMEKNWQPIEDMPFTFMYDPNTNDRITLDINQLREADDNNSPTIINNIDSPEFSGKLCGSSQIIKVGNKYISICHTGHRYQSADGLWHWVYNHYFVMYDENMNRVSISSPFRFVGDCMEFCCGLCHDDKNIYLSFTVLDSTNHIITIPLEKFVTMVEDITNKPNTFDNFDNKPAYEYMRYVFNNGHIIGIDKVPYIFLLESLHMLDSIDRVFDIIEELGDMENFPEYKESLFLHFITRRRDSNLLLKQYQEKYDNNNQ